MEKNNERMKDKISIGLSLEMSLEEYKKIFEEYGMFLHSIYFSPPLDGKYHSRIKISEQFSNPENVSKFYEILALARTNSILLDCVLNRPTIRQEDIEQALPFIDAIQADQITCLEKHIDILKSTFPEKEFIYSYNNDLTPKNIPSISTKFATVVVGKSFLRSKELLKQISTRGFKLKPLVNNGCSYNCGGCKNGNRSCQKTFDRNLQKYDLNYLYALQSIYPFELQSLLDMMEEENIPLESIKISNRTDGYDYLNMCLDSYLNQTPPEVFIERDPKNYRLWSRLGAFNEHMIDLDSKQIQKIKQKGLN